MQEDEDRASIDSESDTIEDLDEIQLRIRIRDLERRIKRLEMIYLEKKTVFSTEGFKHYVFKAFLEQLPLILGVVFLVYALNTS